jgi:hypothetical protein
VLYISGEGGETGYSVELSLAPTLEAKQIDPNWCQVNIGKRYPSEIGCGWSRDANGDILLMSVMNSAVFGSFRKSVTEEGVRESSDGAVTRFFKARNPHHEYLREISLDIKRGNERQAWERMKPLMYGLSYESDIGSVAARAFYDGCMDVPTD